MYHNGRVETDRGSPDTRAWRFEKDEAALAYEREVELEKELRFLTYRKLLAFDPDDVL